MPKLTAIQAPEDTREITLDFGDDVTLTMVIDPSKFTIGRQRKLKKAIKDADLPAQTDILFEIVKEWDLEGDDGKPLPLNQKGFDQLRIETVSAIAVKMAEALGAPKSETSNV